MSVSGNAFEIFHRFFSNTIITIIITLNACLPSTLLFEKSQTVFLEKFESLRKQRQTVTSCRAPLIMDNLKLITSSSTTPERKVFEWQ